jgi:hypothetical protein
MRIRVQHEDGSVEVITVAGDWRATEGKHLNRITDQNGFEHFFTPDGYYDGWGGNVRQPQKAADEALQCMDDKRQIENVR